MASPASIPPVAQGGSSDPAQLSNVTALLNRLRTNFIALKTLLYGGTTAQILTGQGSGSAPAFKNALWTSHDITSSGPFSLAGVQEYIIEGWGAGASGAGGNTSTSQRGSGGGSGPYGYKHVTSNLDTSLTITIGSGGAVVAASASGANGNAGGTTTIVGANLGTLTLNGGGAGQANVAAGGSGGTVAGAWDFSIPGQDGQLSPVVAGSGVGGGGSSPRGGPGGQSNVGSGGQPPGGGGACGNHTGGANSGAGANALVRIWTR